jgi:predicted hydrocarbon binding protein
MLMPRCVYRYIHDLEEQQEKGLNTTVIYVEYEGSVKIYRCPFCTTLPFVSQIKLR